jgi:hypothetical protein
MRPELDYRPFGVEQNGVTGTANGREGDVLADSSS